LKAVDCHSISVGQYS